MENDDTKYFKKRYCISFYDEDDRLVRSFNNIWEICNYKKLESISKNYNLVKVELYRALKRPDQSTRMLNGELMYVYLIDIYDDEDE